MASFLERIFAALDAHPSRPFVTEVHGDRLERVYGAALAQMVGRARAKLRSRGLSAGDRVALLSPNSARWVATDLALLAEGLTVVPLYARQDPEELSFMAADSGCRLVLAATPELAAGLHEAGSEVDALLFDDLFDEKTEPVTEAPLPRADDDPVTIVYTSGTSGRAKGVITTAGNVDFMLGVIDGRLSELLGRPGGEDRVFHYLPFCFAGSRFVLWGNLFRANGVMVSTDLTRLVEELPTAAPEWFLNVPALLERVRHGVEGRLEGQAPPVRALYRNAKAAFGRRRGETTKPLDAVWLALAERFLFPRVRQQIGENLRCLICGSAPLHPDTQAWFQMIGLPVYQVYGLTETTAIVTMDRPGDATPGTVGFAIDGVKLRVADDGELQVQGPNVFSGYWNRDDATAAAFTEDGWFRTGDQAAIDEAGRVSIVGRVKNILVPESGHNVAPEPLEEALVRGLDGVEQAVVVGHGRPFLTAILTGSAERDAVEAGLAEINGALPHYRRIRAFHLTGHPFTPENGLLTANQKLKRGAIAAHFRDTIDALYGQP